MVRPRAIWSMLVEASEFTRLPMVANRILLLVLSGASALYLACGTSTAPSPADTPAPEPPPIDSSRAPVFDQDFWAVWSDGNAELSSYDLAVPKYNAPRKGVAIAIFVTETFSNSARVKADPGKHPKEDEFPVMKLNLMRDFQTGVYDYHEMLSAFVALQPVNRHPAGSLVKASFGSQEWCGHVYSQLLFDAAGIRYTSHSYFDGEADQDLTLEYPGDGLSEDALWLWARGMARPTLAPGETLAVPFLMSLAVSRDRHLPVAWKPVALSRSASAKKIRVPAGEFEVEEYTAESSWGKRIFRVETKAPRRVIEYEATGGEKASLLKTARMKYWELNQPGGESALKELGLTPRPERTN